MFGDRIQKNMVTKIAADIYVDSNTIKKLFNNIIGLKYLQLIEENGLKMQIAPIQIAIPGGFGIMGILLQDLTKSHLLLHANHLQQLQN